MAQSSNTRIPMPSLSRFKRQNENVSVPPEKKRKLDAAPVFKKSASATRLPDVGRFSEAPKRNILRAHVSAGNVRESLPAFTFNKPMVLAKPAPQPQPSASKPQPSAASNKAKKLPAWDLKGRMEQIEKRNANLRDELLTYNQRIVALEDDKSKLNAEVAIKSQHSEEASAVIQNLETEMKSKIDFIKNETRTKTLLQAQNDNLNQEISRLERNLLESESRIKIMSQEQKSEKEAFEAELTSHKSLVSQLTATNSALQTELSAKKLLEDQFRGEIDKLKKYCHELEEKVSLMEAKTRNDETLRRQLHNTIQELKGNVRVFCRIRPPLREELESKQTMSLIQTKNDSKTLEISRTSEPAPELHSKGRNNFEFTFDAIFDSAAQQDDVFIEISQLVQSVLDGYNVCIFAYGQTGSGKTYTMEGPACISNFLTCDDQNLGMIPRSVQQIFSAAKSLESKGWVYKMEASFMEIYNESIRDLLDNSPPSSVKKCQIKKSANNGSDGYISNVAHKVVLSERDVYSLLQKARMNRVVAATHCNEHSSRSHYIFQMKLQGKNDLTDESCEGILNLVDLAGSERIKDSGSAGDRLTEAKNINKSLSNLGNVILALSNKAEHVPYRNSKLTHVLMNSLGGNSKTLMFVNINPCEQNFNETVNSLRFATKVNQCQIGTAQKRTK